MFLIVLQKVEPIHVKLGDPILPVEVTDHDGVVHTLEKVFDEGLLIFLSSHCEVCEDALPFIMESLADRYYCVILYQDKPDPGVTELLKRLSAEANIDAFYVDSSELKL